MTKFFDDLELEKLQSRLRVVANGDSAVNAIRAEHVGSIRVAQWTAATKPLRQGALRSEEAGDHVGDVKPQDAKVKPLKNLAEDIEASVFVTMTEARRGTRTRGQTASRDRYRTATVRISDLRTLAADPSVVYVELGESLRAPEVLDGALDTTFADQGRSVPRADLHQGGRGVLIGIIDVQGFDFAHEDFQSRLGTRFVALWDQAARSRGRVVPTINDVRVPTSCRYGRHLDRDALRSAQRVARDVGVAPSDVEPQTQESVGSHATHVTSIAAGNGGVCPNAMIAGVTLAMSPEDGDRRLAFSDSTRLAHAVDYLLWVADAVGAGAVSINISLGTNGGAHDGSEALSRWIDAALSQPGRAVSVAAGNAGQENPAHENDLGFLMGRIHTEGRIEAADLTRDLEWVVVGNGIADLSENELELWYSAQDRFAVQVRPPGSSTWLRLVEPGEYIENQILPDKTVVSVYNELYHQSNGANKISVFLSPFMTPDLVVGVRHGRWTVRLIGRQVRDGAFHGWIERDDPRPVRRDRDLEHWRFPSFFARGTNVDRSSISSLACGDRVIAVANLDSRAERINRSSSQGPTRVGGHKPDIAAPGTDILAANGFLPEAPWIRKSGTSMASPYVAGVIGLMLATNPRLTAPQIRGILHRTSHPLPGATFEWTDDVGYGVIDAKACVEEARNALSRRDLTPKTGRVRSDGDRRSKAPKGKAKR